MIQTVFGEGPVRAPLFLIGEQPDDHEAEQGRPFVGPVGKVLDGALEAATIRRDDVYLTNAVKYFKTEMRGTRQINLRPNTSQIAACHGWLLQELDAVKPEVIVALGAVAGQSLWGGAFRVGKAQGQVLEFNGHPAVATIHPSAVLRARDAHARHSMMDALVADLRSAATLARNLHAA